MSARVKICGLSTPDTMDAALNAGADYVGLVFFPKSPRNVDVTVARKLAAMASGVADVVALTVDADDALIMQIATEVGPDFIQLHGREPPARVADVAGRANVRTIKSVEVASRDDAAVARNYDGVADLILFDAKPPKGAVLPGGNGLAFDWSAISEVAAEVDFLLAGGLNPDNVAEAIRVTGAPIVDVSSGVERAPGIKDPDLIRAFVAAAKAAPPA